MKRVRLPAQLGRAWRIAPILRSSGVDRLVESLGLRACGSVRCSPHCALGLEPRPHHVAMEPPLPDRMWAVPERLGSTFVKAGQLQCLSPLHPGADPSAFCSAVLEMVEEWCGDGARDYSIARLLLREPAVAVVKGIVVQRADAPFPPAARRSCGGPPSSTRTCSRSSGARSASTTPTWRPSCRGSCPSSSRGSQTEVATSPSRLQRRRVLPRAWLRPAASAGTVGASDKATGEAICPEPACRTQAATDTSLDPLAIRSLPRWGIGESADGGPSTSTHDLDGKLIWKEVGRVLA